MRIDRVVSRLPDGVEHVCTLVLQNPGLHVIHTGDVQQLPGYEPNNTDSAELEAIIKSELRIDEFPLEQLSSEEKSAFVNLADVHNVTVTSETMPPGVEVPVVQLHTSINDYIFLFPYGSVDLVQAFGDALRQAAPQISR
jgi:hypothetical protein